MKTKTEKEQLPPFRPELTSTDRLLEMMALLIIAALWLMVVFSYQILPETIPIHFNIKGEVDGYGSRLTLIIIPLFATLLIPGMLWLSRYPHIFNYPTKITPENKTAQYRLAARFIRIMAVGLGVVFLHIVWMIIHSAETRQDTSSWLIILPILAISFFPLFIYLVMSSKLK